MNFYMLTRNSIHFLTEVEGRINLLQIEIFREKIENFDTLRTKNGITMIHLGPSG